MNALPSDTNLLLTKNYSEIVIFEKFRISYVISGKRSFFPGDFKGARLLKNYTKETILRELFFRNNFVSERIKSLRKQHVNGGK